MRTSVKCPSGAIRGICESQNVKGAVPPSPPSGVSACQKLTKFLSLYARVGPTLVLFPGRREEGERAMIPLFAHVLNCGRIPPVPRTICFYVCTFVTVKMDSQCYIVRTLIACIVRDLDHAHSTVLLQLGTPEVILKPEKRSAIVSLPVATS